MNGSRIEDTAGRDSLQEEETRPGHHIRVISLSDSDAYSGDKTKPGLKTSGKPKEVQSSWSESASNTLSFNERDISSTGSKFGGAIKKPG